MRNKRGLPKKNISTNSGKLTEGAKRALESMSVDYEKRVANKAAEYMLKEKRTEVSESDIQKADKIVRLTTSSRRKWVMRLGTLLGFAVLLSQIQAFSELPNIPPILLVRLYFSIAVILVLMGLFSFCYKDDFL